ncbi:MAG: N-acetylmuramoyl-L-alanine amidase family protein [Verrucomicrobiota bacterium]
MKKIFLIGFFFILPWMARAADFEEVEWKGVAYVTLDSFCKYFQLTAQDEAEKKSLRFKGSLGTVAFGVHSRECRINEILYWMTLPLICRDDGKYLISQMDLKKLLLPVLKPESIVPKKPALGVIIDAGHGGSNDGARARNGLLEKNLNLDTARLLREILRKEGIPCVMTRDSDKYLSLEARARFTERYPAYVFVSIHYNEGRRTSRGIETYCLSPHKAASTGDSKLGLTKKSRVEKGNKHDEANTLLAALIHQQVTQLHPDEGDRGLKRARFVVLRQSRTPAVLVEGGFLSSSEDIAIIKTQEYRQFLAEKIAAGLKKYMEIMNEHPEEPVISPKSPTEEEKEFLSPAVQLREADNTKSDLEVEVRPPDETDKVSDPEDGRETSQDVSTELTTEEQIIKREMEIILKQEEALSPTPKESTPQEKPLEK